MPLIASDSGRRVWGAAGKRCYVIGDVHGRADLLEDLLAQIEADHARRPRKQVILAFLGDLIDRGPDSAGVIERLLDRPPPGFRVLCLMGNHEEALVRGLSDEATLLPAWLDNGGFECAQSYGAPVGELLGASPETMQRVLKAHISERHVWFMARFLETIQFGGYLLVHAGLRPGVPLEQQGRDLRWIRAGFLDSDADFGWMVVHGHTIAEEVIVRTNRIGIDTGAYRTGRLTALRLEDDARDILQAVGAPAAPAAAGQ